jgi:arsenite methyltransferase
MGTSDRVGRASFGVDAPAAVAGMLGLTGVLGVLAVALRRVPRVWPPWVTGAYAVFFGASSAVYLHTTLRGKFEAWQGILDELAPKGDELALDLGCGRGAVLIAAAERLPAGGAIGVDLWRGVDQSHNSVDSTRANAVARGVSDRVELRTADLADLPLPDEHADLVLSSMAFHNIHDRTTRDAAIREAARVLRPGGRLAIADFRFTGRYAQLLGESGLTEVRVRPLGWRFWYGGPWGGAKLVTAVKPR